MKLKAKLISMISAFCLVCVMLVVGIYALKSTNFQMGGEISFKATGVNATISKGVLATGSHVNSSDATTKMQSFSITTAEDQDEINALASSWSGLKLQFNAAGDDATITFTIRNDNTASDQYLGVAITVNQGTVDNAKVTVSPATALIEPTKTQEFVVTFSVTQKDMDASLKGFTLDFNLAHGGVPLDSNLKAGSLTYSLDTTNKIATVTSFDASSSEVVVPAYVYDGTNVYVVRKINSGFYGKVNLTKLTLPETITFIRESSIAQCYNLTMIVLLAPNPPSEEYLGIEQMFSYTSANVYVPAESVDDYKAATGWSNYADKIFPIGADEAVDFSTLSGFSYEILTTSTVKLKYPSSGNVVIPEMVLIDGSCYTVTAISGGFSSGTLIMPSTVSSIEGNFLADSMATSVTLYAEIPPTLSYMYAISPVFEDQLKIYVPAESVEIYKTTTGWSDYPFLIHAIEE